MRCQRYEAVFADAGLHKASDLDVEPVSLRQGECPLCQRRSQTPGFERYGPCGSGGGDRDEIAETAHGFVQADRG